MLQKTKLTLLRLFAIVAFVALFIVASISLASCSSDSKTVTSVYTENGHLYVLYSDSDTPDDLGELDSDAISEIKVSSDGTKLEITYTSGATDSVDISNIVASECEHTYAALPYGSNSDGVIQEKTCGQPGLTLQYCTICGNVRVEIDDDLDAHSYDTTNITWKTDATYTTATATVTCTVCHDEETYDATITSKVTTEATCTTEGEREYTATATINGQEYTTSGTVAIAATGHTYEGHTIVMATSGTAYIYIDGSETPATYEDLVTIFGADHVASTDCKEAGAYLVSQNDLKCETCNEVLVGVTDPFEHTAAEAVNENIVEATCTVDGSHDEVVYCSVCGEELKRETVTDTALGHKLDSGVVTTEPTCEGAGVMTYTCTVCGYTETEEIKAIGHSYSVDTTVGTENDGWIWVIDASGSEPVATATLWFVCANDVTHTHSETATVTTLSTSTHSCTTDASTTYQATVTYENTTYTSTYTYVTKVASHTLTSIVGSTTYTYEYTIDERGYIYIWSDTAQDYVAPTLAEFLAIPGTTLLSGNCESIAYGTISCSTEGKTWTVAIAAGTHTYVESGTTVTGYEWAPDYSYVTLTELCTVCGQYGEHQVTTTVDTTVTDTTTYSATYNGQTYTISFSTASVNSAVTASLSSSATSYNAQLAVSTSGYYAINFTTNSTSYITITSTDGKYSYTDYNAANAVSKSAKAGETASTTVNYLVDEDGNPAFIPSGTVLYVIVSLYDTTSTASVEFTVAEEDAPAMEVGEKYLVTISSNDTAETTITIEEAGYYAISFTDGAIVTVYDDSYTYYYYSGDYYYSYWSGVYAYYYASSMNYIVGYDSDFIISVAANTVLNVEISYYDTEEADIYVLIEEGTFKTLTADVETTISGSDVYTFTATEAGMYIFTVDDDGDVYINTDEIWSDDSTTVTLAVGDVVYVYNNTAYATTSKVEVTKKEPYAVTYTGFEGTVYNLSLTECTASEWYADMYSATAGTTLVEGVLTVSEGSGTITIMDNCLYNNDFSVDASTTVYKGVSLDEGALIGTSGSLTFVLAEDGNVTFYYGLTSSSSLFTLTNSEGTAIFELSSSTATNTYNVLSKTVELTAGTYTLTSTGNSTRLYSIAVGEEAEDSGDTSGDSGDEETSAITYSYNFSNIFTADDQSSLTSNMTGGSDADAVYYFTESGYTTTADATTNYILTYSTHKNNDKIANTSVYYYNGAYVTSIDEGVTADTTYSYAIQPNGATSASNQRYFTINLSEYAGKTVTIEIVGTSKTGCCYMLTTAGVASVDTEEALASNTVAESDYATVDVVSYTGTVTETGLYYITFSSNSSRIYAINITITDAE